MFRYKILVQSKCRLYDETEGLWDLDTHRNLYKHLDTKHNGVYGSNSQLVSSFSSFFLTVYLATIQVFSRLATGIQIQSTWEWDWNVPPHYIINFLVSALCWASTSTSWIVTTYGFPETVSKLCRAKWFLHCYLHLPSVHKLYENPLCSASWS